MDYPGKVQERARPRVYQEATRTAKELIGADGRLLKSYGEAA